MSTRVTSEPASPQASRRLTAQGYAAIFFSLILTTSGILLTHSTQQTTFYMGLALWMCLVISAFGTRWSHRALICSWITPRAVHAGDDCTVGVHVHPHGKNFPLLICATDPQTEQLDVIAAVPALNRSDARYAWLTSFPQRGIHTLPPLVARSQQYFGLIDMLHPLPQKKAQTLVVYPALGKMRNDLAVRINGLIDSASCGKKLGDEEFLRLRPYYYGDSMRQVHWRASARAQEILVGVHGSPDTHHLALAIDTSCSIMPNRKFEQLLSMAATIIRYARECQWSVSLHGIFTPSGGLHGSEHDLMNALAHIDAHPTPLNMHTYIPRHMPTVLLGLHLMDETSLPHSVLALNIDEAEEFVAVRKQHRKPSQKLSRTIHQRRHQ